jgi:hypothetical protein
MLFNELVKAPAMSPAWYLSRDVYPARHNQRGLVGDPDELPGWYFPDAMNWQLGSTLGSAAHQMQSFWLGHFVPHPG